MDGNKSYVMHLTWRAAIALALVCSVTAGATANSARARRMALLAEGTSAPSLSQLQRALDDEDPLVARTAARLLVGKGPQAIPALKQSLDHQDTLVRRNAALGLGGLGETGLDLIETALSDPNPLVRQAGVIALGRVRPHTARMNLLLRQATGDDTEFVRNATILVTRNAYDVVQSIRLGKSGWRFRLDPEEVGRKQAWFKPGYDDGEWAEIETEQFWGDAGYDYVGVAWYRRTFRLPEKPRAAKTQLAFGAVDESAWVWINGKLASVYDIGAEGWDKPFRLDVTGLLKWNGENQIAVRVYNRAMAGGIWKPVKILCLQQAR